MTLKQGEYVGHGPWEQVSRLGNPLFNEVLVPMAEKDQWNGAAPRRTRRYAQYVDRPELQGLLPVPLPGRVPEPGGLQQAAGRPQRDPAHRDPEGVVDGLPELHRAGRVGHAAAQRGASRRRTNPNNLGLVAGDAAGFPNGRRIDDDVVTIELRAIAGLTIPLVDPTYEPDGAASQVTDGTENTNADSTGAFPYLGLPGGGYQTVPGTTQAS